MDDTYTLGLLVGPPPVFRDRLLILTLLYDQFAKEGATDKCHAVVNEVLLDEMVHEKLWKGKPRGN